MLVSSTDLGSVGPNVRIFGHVGDVMIRVAGLKADFKPPLRTKLGMTRQDLNSLNEVSQRT